MKPTMKPSRKSPMRGSNYVLFFFVLLALGLAVVNECV